MNAAPLADVTAPPETDAAGVPPWMYRSEAFAEDLDEMRSGGAAPDDETPVRRSLPRLALPLTLSVLMLCVGAAAVFGLA